MNKAKLIVIIAISTLSCSKEEPTGKDCQLTDLQNFGSQENTIIPLHSQNFWMYSDSLWEVGTGNFESEKSTLITIEEIYDLDGMTAVNFSSILPLLTIKGDSLFSTLLTPGPSSTTCFDLLFPMFFATVDTVQVDTEPSPKIIFRSTAPITTPTGVYTNNIVYRESDFYEVIINEEVGIVKIYFFINTSGTMQKRRTLTLKDFALN
jgi:hypothetical protein